jgi:hypothetical protein
MPRVFLLASCLTICAVGSVSGHHSYGEYDRRSVVTLEGTIQLIRWVNPHVLLTLDTGSGPYLVEWLSARQLDNETSARALNPGDHIVVRGSVNRNPEKKIITLLKDIRRPTDGWAWTDYAQQSGQ